MSITKKWKKRVGISLLSVLALFVGLALLGSTDMVKNANMEREAKKAIASTQPSNPASPTATPTEVATSTATAEPTVHPTSTESASSKPSVIPPSSTPTAPKATEPVRPVAPVPIPVVPSQAPDISLPAYRGIICKDGTLWPGNTRQGACHGHGGIAN